MTEFEVPDATPRQPIAELNLLSVIIEGQPALNQWLPLPKSWTQQDAPGPYLDLVGIPRPIGVYASGQSPAHLGLLVTVTSVPFEVRLEDWVEQERACSGFLLQRQSWQSSVAGPRLVSWSTKAGVVCASVAFADTGRVFVAHCVADRRWIADVAGVVEHFLLESSLQRPGTPGRLEALYSAHAGRHTFQIPASWRWAQRHATAELIDPRGPTRARLQLRVIEGPIRPTATRHKALQAQLRARRWTPARAFGSAPRDMIRDGWVIAELDVHNHKQQPCTMLIAHGTIGDCEAELLATSSKQTPRCWQRTIRALEIAIDTLRISPSDNRQPDAVHE